MIYDISLKLVEELERKQCECVFKWLGFAKHLTNVALFSKDVPITLPLKSLVELFKTTKVRSYLQLKYSSDESVAVHAKPHVGRTWSALTAIEDAESSLQNDRIIGDRRGGGTDVPIRAGIGYVEHKVCAEPEGSTAHRKDIIGKVKEQQNEKLKVKAVQQSVQGAWLAWTDYIKRDVSWKYAFTADSKLLKFCVGATYNTKGTPQ